MSQVLRIRNSSSSREIDVEASSSVLLAIGGALKSGVGLIEADPCPWLPPFDSCLTLLQIRSAVDHKVVLVVTEQGFLEISGQRELLDVLGENLIALAQDGDSGEHLHVDYFPGHYYLGPESEPAVFTKVM